MRIHCGLACLLTLILLLSTVKGWPILWRDKEHGNLIEWNSRKIQVFLLTKYVNFSDQIRGDYIGEKWFKCPVMGSRRDEEKVAESPLKKLDKFNWFTSSSITIHTAIILYTLLGFWNLYTFYTTVNINKTLNIIFDEQAVWYSNETVFIFIWIGHLSYLKLIHRICHIIVPSLMFHHCNKTWFPFIHSNCTW